MKRNKRKNILGKKASDLLELPQYLVNGQPHITIEGNNGLLLENYQSIIEYKQECLRIQTTLGCIKIEGRSMEVQSMDADSIKVTGKINAVLIQTTEE